jgi:hypothetical protein
MRTAFFWFLVLCVIAAFFLGLGLFSAHARSVGDFFRDQQIVQWVGVTATFAVVFIALLLNVTTQELRRPRFRVTCGEGPPLQIITLRKDQSGAEMSVLHVRLRIDNTGRTAEGVCEVRLEGVWEVKDADGHRKALPRDHDPRALLWVGRKQDRIALNAGAFDLVDLGAQNARTPEHFVLLFGKRRGGMDLCISDVREFRLTGTVYGSKAKPRRFTFRMTWDPDREPPGVEIQEIKPWTRH